MSNSKPQWAMGIALVLGLTISGCSELGKKYCAFTVTSDPSGAEVVSLIENKLGGKIENASLGRTPTKVIVVHYAFGAPGVRDTKVGIKVQMPGYEDQEVFFRPSDWYKTPEEAQSHVRSISVVLKAR
jgi:hypothetical protein